MTKAGEQILAGLSEVLDNMDYVIERQRFLETHPPKCEDCKNDTQPLEIYQKPATWVCKVCKRTFKLEIEGKPEE